MGFLDRRDLLGGAAALFGAELVAPLARALAAEQPTTTAVAPGFAASHAVLTSDQRSLIAAISERIIPTTDTPGAIAAGVPGFVEMMLADWYAPTERNEFMDGLGILAGHVRVQFNRSFVDLAPEEQDLILTEAMTGRVSGLSRNFFEHCRQLTITGYYTSEIGCKQERVYVPVPGHYDGKYPYAQVRRIFSS
ncbi:MAG TPA: gluconate 2-dehydrogenase subunit 3 family protein [Rhizomicrobium sp.]|jgi:gluconate 2-dehydrogenase gamma chain|nr:gluconate 2-dehydrogenase subunit 3 family protein [Rhizomicrobium sp.]